MISTLSKKIARYIGDNNDTEGVPLEVYEYGLELVISTIFSCMFLLSVAWIFGVMLEAVVYIMCFGFLRIWAGGYHASTHLKCCTTYAIFAFATIFLIKSFNVEISIQTIGIVMICLMSIYLIFRYAPVDTENKPLSKSEYDLYKRRSRIFVVSFSFSIFLVTLAIPTLTYYATIATGAVFVQSMTLLPIFNEKG
ncbi:MAG: accessory gene regulator ArgB-like protein [Eubacteriaceae bacterium]